MTYLLDTSTLSDLMRENPRTMNWLSSIDDIDRAVTCPIVRGEIEYGIVRLAPGRRRTELEAKAGHLFSLLPCKAIPEQAGQCYAAIKLARQLRGCPMDENDLWIAATAMALAATLVTRDTDFEQTEGLSTVTLR